MAAKKAVWGIDIGQCALKALKLTEIEGQLQVAAFDVVEHPRILSEPEADRQQLIQEALGQFLARNKVADSRLCIAVPGQASFTRFVKLPPVESKKIPEIVRFEAEQQIPFPIADVIWRWQIFQDPDSPDVEVGIFAMKREDVTEMLGHFDAMEMRVDVVQMAPLALYNFLAVEGLDKVEGAVLLADVGADKTDLVVADGPRIWTRTIQIGGNNFTEALVKAFKLSFAKAERLKRSAATSKYARQIFHAMRPVFADLVQEMQRSIGYYTSLHRETRFKRLVGLGNGFRLPGLQKFLEQNLQVPVTRVDSYNRPITAEGVNVATFTENVLSLAVAYGLAAQGMGNTPVATNLLPEEIARKRRWARKRPWFATAAAMLLVMFGLWIYSPYRGLAKLAEDSPDYAQVRRISGDLAKIREQLGRLRGAGQEDIQTINNNLKMYGYRDYWPEVMAMISQSLAGVAKDQPLLAEYAAAETDELRQAVLEKIQTIARNERWMVFVEELSVEYYADIEQAKLGTTGQPSTPGAVVGPIVPPGMPAPGPGGRDQPRRENVQRGFKIVLRGRTPLPAGVMAGELMPALFRQSREFASAKEVFTVRQVGLEDRLRRVGDETTVRRTAGPAFPATPRTPTATTEAGPLLPDPMFAAGEPEDMADDTRFAIGWIITINDDGVEIPKIEEFE